MVVSLGDGRPGKGRVQVQGLRNREQDVGRAWDLRRKGLGGIGDEGGEAGPSTPLLAMRLRIAPLRMTGLWRCEEKQILRLAVDNRVVEMRRKQILRLAIEHRVVMKVEKRFSASRR
jgi:hypothetical protein